MYEQDRISSTMTSAPAQQRPSQVAAVFQEMERTLEEAHKTAAELEGRLQPLLRSEPEAAGSTPKDSQPTLVGLASTIDGYTRQLKVIILTQQSILRRLEL